MYFSYVCSFNLGLVWLFQQYFFKLNIDDVYHDECWMIVLSTESLHSVNASSVLVLPQDTEVNETQISAPK